MPLLFHAEMDAPIPAKPHDHSEPDATLYASFLDSRPDAYETTAIELIIRLGKEFPAVPLHIVHLSSAEALPAIRQAKLDGVDLTVETCYHYLWCVCALLALAVETQSLTLILRSSASRQSRSPTDTPSLWALLARRVLPAPDFKLMRPSSRRNAARRSDRPRTAPCSGRPSVRLTLARFRNAPPQQLTPGLLAVDGTIDYVVSDHSPCVPSLKNPCTGDFFTAWVRTPPFLLRARGRWR